MYKILDLLTDDKNLFDGLSDYLKDHEKRYGLRNGTATLSMLPYHIRKKYRRWAVISENGGVQRYIWEKDDAQRTVDWLNKQEY